MIRSCIDVNFERLGNLLPLQCIRSCKETFIYLITIILEVDIENLQLHRKYEI